MEQPTVSQPGGSRCWGVPIRVDPSLHCCSRLELYEEAAIWRQSSCQVLQEDPMKPLRDLITEMVPDWQAGLPEVGGIRSASEARKAAETATPPSRLGDLMTKMLSGESADSFLSRIARDMVAVGYLGAEVLEWAQAQAQYSLMVSFEHVPVSLFPPGERGERSASLFGLVRRIGVRQVTIPRKVKQAWDDQHGRSYHLVEDQRIETERSMTTERIERVAGRMIWDPWPFLLVHTEAELVDLLAKTPGRVTLQEMRRVVGADGTEILMPIPMQQVRVVASKVIPRGTLPLEVVGGLPTVLRLAAHHRRAMASPFRSTWNALLEAMEPQHLLHGNPRFWVLRA